jgi:hypothetical protein
MKKLLMAIIPLIITVNVYAQTVGAVTFYAYGKGDPSATNNKSPAGHTFVTVSTDSGYEETVGFYGSNSGITPLGTGRLLNDEANIYYAKTGYTVRITSNQLNRVRAVIADWRNNPRFYGWKDCVGFAEEIAEACGLRHKGAKTQFPMTFIEDLYELN